VSGVSVFSGKRDIGAELGSDLVEQIGIHEFVFVGNVQRDDVLASESLGKLPAETIQVRLLHAEDNVGPAQMPLCDYDPGVRLCADGTNLIEGEVLEILLGREAADPVLAADKKQFLWNVLIHTKT
jgi:hypothetical protein